MTTQTVKRKSQDGEMCLYLKLCLSVLLQTILGLQSSDRRLTRIFASIGDSVRLPCGTSYINSCSSVTWSVVKDGFDNQLELSGKVKADGPNSGSRLKVGQDCSLHIQPLEIDDGRVYTCGDGATSSSVSLQLLNITLATDTNTAPEMDIKLQCYLNIFSGLVPQCNHSEIKLNWLNEANTVLQGERFQTERSSACFSTLTIRGVRKTDHHRKWRCQLIEGEVVKTSLSYTTEITGGIEEVFVAVGESVSLPCATHSSLEVGSRFQWTLGQRSLSSLSRSGDVSAGTQGHLPASHISQDGSLVISNVKTLHSGLYNCSQQNRILLHTLDVSAEYATTDGNNLTLTCSLTCVEDCGDFNLSWIHSGQDGLQSGPIGHNNTLISKLFLPDRQGTEKIACAVLREGVEMAVKEWTIQRGHVLPAVVWSVLLLLLLCAVGGGVYWKRQGKGSAAQGEEQQTPVGMTHLYDEIQDQPIQPSGVTNNSFYDLLQAGN
ncbi:uncharacterized protein LOC109905451 [Oncorhynchus kisutch]|uniref:uncharacterized protein LOC109905451 n=1 Tax=Oncorhynchus kisutch TaxID=8019 RepID=UPI0012DCD46C|nr:uncharacterized protein LOC109905451 [Oncorhynchus kisutch]